MKNGQKLILYEPVPKNRGFSNKVRPYIKCNIFHLQQFSEVVKLSKKLKHVINVLSMEI
jgi:hypothetical protein